MWLSIFIQVSALFPSFFFLSFYFFVFFCKSCRYKVQLLHATFCIQAVAFIENVYLIPEHWLFNYYTILWQQKKKRTNEKWWWTGKKELLPRNDTIRNKPNILSNWGFNFLPQKQKSSRKVLATPGIQCKLKSKKTKKPNQTKKQKKWEKKWKW